MVYALDFWPWPLEALCFLLQEAVHVAFAVDDRPSLLIWVYHYYCKIHWWTPCLKDAEFLESMTRKQCFQGGLQPERSKLALNY